jgi:hypothetical protein
MTDDEIEFLTGSDGHRWLQGAAAGRHSLAAARILRKEISADRARLVIQQAELRRRGAEKFSLAERMFFTKVGLEQATDEAVARYKASRLPAGVLVADLCCGIGGDLVAIAARGPAVGVERDPAVARIAEANARIAGTTARVVISEVDRTPVVDFAAWHIDPDRRREGKRTTRVASHDPGLEVIARLLRECPHGAIKLAPAADVALTSAGGSETAADVPWHEAELEWISRKRECRQLVAWFGSVADLPGMRRATVVLNDVGDHGPIRAESIVGHRGLSTPIAAAVRRYVFEPDSGVLAADLRGAIGECYKLEVVSANAAYFTGDSPVVTPLLSTFEVIEVLPYDARKLNRWLRARSIGTVEVKKRGVEIDPARVQRELSGNGDDSATVLLCPIGNRVRAIVARRT